MKTVDLTLNISAQAWAILHLLARHTDLVPQGVLIDTAPFYNGRERGFVIAVHNYTNAHFITFAENRNSDSIFVAIWQGEYGLNPPTVSDFPEQNYQTRLYFNYNETHKASEHVKTLIECAGIELSQRNKRVSKQGI